MQYAGMLSRFLQYPEIRFLEKPLGIGFGIQIAKNWSQTAVAKQNNKPIYESDISRLHLGDIPGGMRGRGQCANDQRQ
jgi:hypothetical protein